MRNANPPGRGPSPWIVLVTIVAVLLLIAALLAAIRVYLHVGPMSARGVVRDDGSIGVIMCRTGDCEGALLAALSGAVDVRCAFYELDLNRTADALRDDSAQVLVFSDNIARAKAVGLLAAPVGSAGLMHDKFCVVDDRIVTTGSMNPTVAAQSKNDENLLVIRSGAIARSYRAEWENLHRRAQGAKGAKPRVDAPAVDLSGSLVRVCFAPSEDCEAPLVRALDGANASIHFMAFSFTSDAVGDALVRAHARGVDVRGVVERRQIDDWSEYDPLILAGVPVLKDGNAGTMHHKVFVIDAKTTVTGSYNPTANAKGKNDENLLVIEDPALAQAYETEYARVAAAAR